MVSGNDRDIRDLTLSIKDLVQAIKSLEKTNRELLGVQKTLAGIETPSSFEKYMDKPETGQPLVLGMCGYCAMGRCKNSMFLKSNCSCCNNDHIQENNND